MKVQVVTAYVPINVIHLTPATYHDYGRALEDACDGRLRWFDQYPLERCWLYEWLLPYGFPPTWVPPATETPKDRYPSEADHCASNIVQHSRTQWALAALAECVPAEVIVWLDLAILKQGDFTGKRITQAHVRDFLKRVEDYEFNDIPFPGIEGKKPLLPRGNNWRFCGSTHIWPVKHLRAIDHHYKFWTKEFIREHKCIPIDLAIWPTVEEKSGLPFKWYKAEYDYTQLTEFPHV